MAPISRSAFPRRFFVLLYLISLLSLTVFASGPDEQGEKRENPVEREQWFLHGRTYKGKVAPQLLQRAQKQRDTLRHQAILRAKLRSSVTSGASSTPVWTPLGPAPLKSVTTVGDTGDYGLVTGRATAVVVDQNDPTGNTVYLGGAYGGVWKSTSAANSDITKVFWKPITDDQATTAVGAIAVQPGNGNILLVGTGEANSSSDSYYGLGILRSTDAGNSWTLITSANGDRRPFHGLAFSKIAFNTDDPNIVVAATAAASEGITVGAEDPANSSTVCKNSTPSATDTIATCRGLYYSLDSGQTWNQATMVDPGPATPDNGSASSVIYNAQEHKFYAASRFHGIYVSSDGMTFTRMGADAFGFSQPNSNLSTTNCGLTPNLINPTCALYRAEISVVPGRDEMYVWYVDSSTTPVNGGIYQTKDGGKNWTTLNVTGINSCGDTAGCATEQGDYNLALLAIPNGQTATDLYAGAINIFRCQISSTNPTCTASPFVNLTHVYGCTPAGSFSKVHPDQHAFDFSQTNPNIIYFANDGGIYRTLAALNANSVPTSCQANPPNNPYYPFDNLNGTMGSMTQFVWFAQHPSDQYIMLGGTQDNGSPAIDGSNSGSNGLTWRSVQGGDGGYSDINPNNANEWFAATTRANVFRCPNGTACTDSQFATVISSSRVGSDTAAFYMPYMLDPQDSTKLIVGTCRVWRTSNLGTNATVLSQNFATGALGAVCASKLSDNTPAPFISALAAGGPLTAGVGSQVIYAGTTDGNVFANASAVSTATTWSTVSNNAGFSNTNGYPISGIGLDPRDATGKTAYVTVMGFKTGHVFQTANAGTSWTDITGNIPDSPANGVVVDKASGTIYVATDVGVFSTDTPNGASTVWTEVGPATGTGALPNVAVTRIAIFAPSGAPSRLRVSTYGRGIWEMPLASSPSYSIAVSNPTLLTYPSQPVTYQGFATATSGYSGTVALSCNAGSGAIPSVCNPNPVSLSPTISPTNFAVDATDSNLGTYLFRVQGVDTSGLTWQTPVSLRVIDFALNTPSPASISLLPHGDSASVQLSVSSLGSFDQQVTFSCTGLPSLWSCSAAPVTPGPGGTAQTVLMVNSDPSTPENTYTINIVASWTAGNGIIRTKSQPLAVTVAQTSFTLGGPQFTPAVAKVSQPLTATISVSSVDVPNKNITLSCTGNSSLGISPSACSFNPATLPGVGSTPVTSILTLNTNGGSAGNGQVTVTASDGTTNKVAVLPFTLTDYTVANISQPNDVMPGGTSKFTFQLAPSAGYSGTVALACDTSAFSVPVTCSFSPGSPMLVEGTTVAVTGTISVPSTEPVGSFSVGLKTNDVNVAAIIHNQTVPSFNVSAAPDYQMSFGSTNSATVTAGGTATGTLAVTAVGSFNSPVNFTYSGCPSNTTCSILPSTVNPTSASPATATLTIMTKAASVGAVRGSGGPRNYLAVWIGLSFGAFGIVILKRPRVTSALLAVTFAILLGLSACGGGGGGGGGTTPVPIPGTPAGTYTIVVTGTAGTTVKTANFTLTVQ